MSINKILIGILALLAIVLLVLVAVIYLRKSNVKSVAQMPNVISPTQAVVAVPVITIPPKAPENTIIIQEGKVNPPIVEMKTRILTVENRDAVSYTLHFVKNEGRTVAIAANQTIKTEPLDKGQTAIYFSKDGADISTGPTLQTMLIIQ